MKSLSRSRKRVAHAHPRASFEEGFLSTEEWQGNLDSHYGHFKGLGNVFWYWH